MRMPIVTLAALLLAGTASAKEAGSQQTRDYIQAAGQSDTFEIMEATTALAQSTDPKVRAFAEMMIREHGQTSQALKQAAERSGLASPMMDVGAGLSPFLAALQSARGQEFDRTYWRQQALAHRSALTTAQAYAASGDDPDVRQAAVSAVPIISAHLAMAEQMAAQAGNS